MARMIALKLTAMLILLSSILIIFFFDILTIDATKDNGNGDCDSSYPDTCITIPPPNLNCGDISDKRFEVLPLDPHGFDRDEDGIGCET